MQCGMHGGRCSGIYQINLALMMVSSVVAAIRNRILCTFSVMYTFSSLKSKIIPFHFICLHYFRPLTFQCYIAYYINLINIHLNANKKSVHNQYLSVYFIHSYQICQCLIHNCTINMLFLYYTKMYVSYRNRSYRHLLYGYVLCDDRIVPPLTGTGFMYITVDVYFS